MKKLFFLGIIFFISNSLYALELKGTFYQGNLILGKTEPGSNVFVDTDEIKVSKKGTSYGMGSNKKTKKKGLKKKGKKSKISSSRFGGRRIKK